MPPFDGKEFAKAIIDSVKDHVSGALAPILARLDAVEKRAPERGEKGDPGKDGVDGKDGAAGADGTNGLPGEKGERGKDGAAGERGLQGEKGLDGKDGRDGQPGRDGLQGVPGEKGLDGRDGKDGREGVDGEDGFGLDDFDVKSDDDGRTFIFSFSREGREPIVRTVKTAIMLDRGVWKEGAFEKGDSVTWGGSTFIARRDTADKPETSDAWRLAVKRGRDGRDGKDGKPGERGAEGPRGRDLTQMTLQGEKF